MNKTEKGFIYYLKDSLKEDVDKLDKIFDNKENYNKVDLLYILDEQRNEIMLKHNAINSFIKNFVEYNK